MDKKELIKECKTQYNNKVDLQEEIKALKKECKEQAERIDNLNYMYEAMERSRDRWKEQVKEQKETINRLLKSNIKVENNYVLGLKEEIKELHNMNLELYKLLDNEIKADNITLHEYIKRLQIDNVVKCEGDE